MFELIISYNFFLLWSYIFYIFQADVCRLVGQLVWSVPKQEKVNKILERTKWKLLNKRMSVY